MQCELREGYTLTCLEFSKGGSSLHNHITDDSNICEGLPAGKEFLCPLAFITLRPRESAYLSICLSIRPSTIYLSIFS